eukprot:scaffold229223_cov29-Attheya_sp.AAC.1
MVVCYVSIVIDRDVIASGKNEYHPRAALPPLLAYNCTVASSREASLPVIPAAAAFTLAQVR